MGEGDRGRGGGGREKKGAEGWVDKGRGREREHSLFTRVIDKHVCFLHQSVARTRDYFRYNYTCTYISVLRHTVEHMK